MFKLESQFDVELHKKTIPGWSQEYTQIQGGLFHGATIHAVLGDVELFEERMNLRVEQEFQSPEKSLVLSFDMNEGALYVLRSGTQNLWVTPENYKEVSIVVKGHEWERFQRQYEFGDMELRPVFSPFIKIFFRWLSSVLEGAVEIPAGVARERLKEQILEDCSFMLEQGFECGEQRSLSSNEKNIVKRVIEYAEYCRYECGGAKDLALAAGVDVRELLQVFRLYAGVTPTQWLRLRRLNAVRKDLLRASRNETTVAEIAMRWSFWHLGRFSGAYFDLFGEHPKTTLWRPPMRDI